MHFAEQSQNNRTMHNAPIFRQNILIIGCITFVFCLTLKFQFRSYPNNSLMMARRDRPTANPKCTAQRRIERGDKEGERRRERGERRGSVLRSTERERVFSPSSSTRLHYGHEIRPIVWGSVARTRRRLREFQWVICAADASPPCMMLRGRFSEWVPPLSLQNS